MYCAAKLYSKLIMAVLVCLVLCFLSGPLLASTAGHDIKSRGTGATTRAEQTMRGMLHYYWSSDPLHPKIKYFLVCGQTGGVGAGYAGRCTCVDPKSCVNCYRWYDAVSLESVATYGIYMNTTNNSMVPETIFNHSPYNADWNATAECTFIDDFSWYGLAYLRVYEWLKDEKWLNRSVALFDWAWQYGWDEPCGGFWWNTCIFSMFKDSITIVEVMHFSAKLSYMFPNEPRYLERAQRVWNWFFSFDGGYGLMSDKYLVSTGAIPERCCNATSPDDYTRCHNSKVSGTSYNQGLLISASAYLYLRTGDESYLKVGLRALDAILANYTTKEGILIDEPRSYQPYQDYCIAGQDPGGDWYSFSGIFMVHLGYFTELLYENGSLPKETMEKISSLIENTSNAAWTRSAVWPPFKKGVDVCDIGGPKPNPNITYPKFHWWWGQSATKQQIPPDPRYFMHKLDLRCYSLTDSQIWEGLTKTEVDCTNKCRDNPHCSKYLFNVNQEVAGINCWLWNYNRTDHTCPQDDYSWYVGMKRPLGDATCAGRCGSKEPQKLDHGVCYCDPDCAKHLDCCLDYADHCLAGKPPSCKGVCNKVQAQPIPGGGYCWCYAGCNPWFTDNNSDSSCCPDYPEECLAIKMPTCLDSRSQGSALNLFLAHTKLAQITEKERS